MFHLRLLPLPGGYDSLTPHIINWHVDDAHHAMAASNTLPVGTENNLQGHHKSRISWKPASLAVILRASGPFTSISFSGRCDMLQTSTAIALAPAHGAELSPSQVLKPRIMTLGMQHLPCFSLMTSEAFTTTNQRAFSDKSGQSGLLNTLVSYKTKQKKIPANSTNS
jgi:hypothetical protein